MRIFLALCVVFCIGCSETDPELFRIGSVPPLSELEVTSVLKAGGSLDPSGVIGGRDCEVVMVGRRWASLGRILSDGSIDTLRSRIPGLPAGANLVVGGDGRVLLSATGPEYLGEIERDLSFSRLPIPLHPWGGRWTGPLLPIDNGHFALAPVSDRSRPLPSPEPWISAPLVQIVNYSGQVVGRAGRVSPEGGRYLTWLGSRIVLGYSRDTLSALYLSDGEIRRYTAVDGEFEWSFVGSVNLPQYFPPPAVTEELIPIPWFTAFDRFKHHQVSQVLAGAFAGDRVYVIRNYTARWNRFTHPDLEARGEWEVLDHGLEVYDSDGRVLGRYALPAKHLRVFSVDVNGRIFMVFGDSIIVARVPDDETPECAGMPGHVVFPFEDKPPSGSR